MTMIDTNILVDLLEADPGWADWSKGALVDAIASGPVHASSVVLGELASRFGDLTEARQGFAAFGVDLANLDPAATFRAGLAQTAYRAAGGSREKLLGDFLIGGHAASEGRPLLTRDPRPYRRYFPDLTLITPETHP